MELLLPEPTFGRAPLVVFALLAAILMLVGITAVSAIDFTNDKRR
jgi:hypothetical protein